MTVSPTATLVAPCSVIESDVPGTVFPLVPTFWTKAIAARASDPAGPASNTRARSVRVRSHAPVRFITLVMLRPPSTPHPDSSIDGTRPSPARPFAFEYRPSVAYALAATQAKQRRMESRTAEIQGVGSAGRSATGARLRRPLPLLRARGWAARALDPPAGPPRGVPRPAAPARRRPRGDRARPRPFRGRRVR